MSLSWHRRKTRLAALLKSEGQEDEEGIALDRLTHGQSVIGRTSKTMEIDSLRFGDRDLDGVGTLEFGQFGVIDVVTCRLNNCVYVRKSVEKKFALRTRDQCSPQLERDILLQALKTQSPWAPHLLCAFQTPTHLSLVMDYAEGGTLWDVLESSPHDGRIPESDLRWWIPQAVSAIHWCHSQGFAHRDIKPHNFVLSSDAHVLLIDFGSAAPLLPPSENGSQRLPQQYCRVPCGTCDYISPEVLRAHEEALVALEMDDDQLHSTESKELGEYGLESDWWSLGAMIYELAYGVAPFFAPDIRSTYLRIMNHEKSLKFGKNVAISHELQHFLRRLLTDAKKRIGRRNVMEITDHPFFEQVDWLSLPAQTAPEGLHLPHFIYSEPKPSAIPASAIPEQSDNSQSHSQGFAFSALFQSSSVSPGLSILRPSPGTKSNDVHRHFSSSSAAESFIGFSWGPPIDAFPEEPPPPVDSLRTSPNTDGLSTPSALFRSSGYLHRTPVPTTHNLLVPDSLGPSGFSAPITYGSYSTPLKPYSISPHATLPRTSTIRRTAPRRSVSDREAMKQLVDCVGMSARKKVLESGRKPRILNIFTSKSKASIKKELRFDELARPIPGPDYSAASSSKERSRSRSRSNSTSRSSTHLSMGTDMQQANLYDTSDIYDKSIDIPNFIADDSIYSSAETTDSECGVPPSPSPSPRPGSAMSIMSMTMLSRRSSTPTVSGFLNSGSALRRTRSGSGSGSGLSVLPSSSSADKSVTATGTMTATMATPTSTMAATTSGLLSVPTTAGAEKGDFKRGPPVGMTRTRTEDQQPVAPAAKTSSNYPPLVPLNEHPDEPSTVDIWSRTEPTSDWLVELEERHAVMMCNIQQLEERLEEVSLLITR